MDDEKNSPMPPAPEKPTLNEQVIEEGVKKILFGTQIKEFFFPDGKHLRNDWLVIVIVIGLSVYGGLVYETHILNPKITKLTDSVKLKDDAISELKGELKDAKQDRDKYQLQLAPFQAMAIKIYTNVLADERLDAFADQLTSVSSNLVAAIESERPYFEFYINNRLVTNGSSVSLKANRRLELIVRNISSATAEGLSVELSAPLGVDPTNLICGQSWMGMPLGTTVENGVISTNAMAYRWVIKSVRPIPERNSFGADTLELSTNLTYPVMTFQFDLYAVRSKRQTYIITLTFQ